MIRFGLLWGRRPASSSAGFTMTPPPWRSSSSYFTISAFSAKLPAPQPPPPCARRRRRSRSRSSSHHRHKSVLASASYLLSTPPHCVVASPMESKRLPSLFSLSTTTITTATTANTTTAHVASFSTSRASTSAAAANTTTTGISEADFDRIADDMLERLCEELEEELEPTAGEDFEIDYAMGVLTLVLDESKTYVLNKQRPNRQVWLSSPISGPRRFELDVECREMDDGVKRDWRDVRNDESLISVLQGELHEVTGVQLSLLEDFFKKN